VSENYDAIILGAGINGVAIARALALEGKTICVIDKSSIGSGASSRSSRLIHGGLRYLEHFEFSLVKEALKDQKRLLELYPELVELHPFYLPHYKNSKRPQWMIKMGLWIYSFFGFHQESSKSVKKEDFLRDFPLFRQKNLKYVYKYYDAMTQDLALTARIAEEAKDAGAIFKENSKINGIDLADKEILVSCDETLLQSPLLINATGAWIDEVNTKFQLPSRFSIEKLSGIHLVIDGLLVPEPLILETQSQRIIFILPQINTTLIGTTERVETANIDEVSVNEADVNYLLKELNLYLEKPLVREDVMDVFIGVRPIIKTKKDPSKMSREYKLDLHQLGNKQLLHVYGGKLTTFNSLANKALEQLKG